MSYTPLHYVRNIEMKSKKVVINKTNKNFDADTDIEML